MGDLSKNFSRREFQSKDGAPGYDTVDAELLRVLQSIRDHYGAAVTINSGHRSPAHNKAVDGAGGSLHLFGRAADFSVAGKTPREVAAFVKRTYSRVSVGEYARFTHIDTRSNGPVYWKG